MSSGVAPGPIIIAIGSPGATRSSTNTTTSTPNSVGTAHSRRLSCWAQATAAVSFGAGSGLGFAHRLREQIAGHVRLHGQALLEQDRLHLLVERQHERVVGDVAVDLLPAGDPLGLVLLAPERPDPAVEPLRLPGRMRAR